MYGADTYHLWVVREVGHSDLVFVVC